MTKIKDEELKQVKDLLELQNKYIIRLGEVELQLTSLKAEKEAIIKQVSDVATKRDQYLEELKEIYGDGGLNIDTGEFTATK